jgi:glycosyltransferase 2 family protein
MVFTVAMMWVITALPISIGGIGVREISLVYLLGLNGISSDQALALSAVNYIYIVTVAIFSSLFLFDIHKLSRQPVSR